jgi:hypothetical protein
MLNERDSDRIEGKRLEDNASFVIAAVPWYKNSEKQRKTAKNCGETASVLLFFARGIRCDPGFLRKRTPHSLIIRGKNSKNSGTRLVQL